MGRIKYIKNKKYGKLTVIEKTTQRKRHSIVWKCECDCGNTVYVSASQLSNGKKSCGCLKLESQFKKGNKAAEKNVILYEGINIAKSRLYKIFSRMKGRCYNPNNKDFNHYGMRGIDIFDGWLNNDEGFLQFYKWSINNGYKKWLSIDRIDNNKGYSPENCRWVTQKIQCNNRSNNSYVNYKSKKYTYSEFEEIYGINQRNISKLIKNGYTIDDIVLKYKCLKNKEVCNFLNTTKYKLRRLIKNKTLVPDFIDKAGHYYFLEEQIIKYKNKGGETVTI